MQRILVQRQDCGSVNHILTRTDFSKTLTGMKSIKAIFASVIFIAALAAHGQVTSITDQTQTPVADSGHDYIQDMQETVNPANGQLSVRINIPTGKGRGYSLPFSIDYDSGSVWIPQAYPPALAPNVDASPEALMWFNYGTQNSIGGWSYSVPYASRTEAVQNYQVGDPLEVELNNGVANSVGSDEINFANDFFDCTYAQDYMYTDPEGGSHALYVTSYYNVNGSTVYGPCGTTQRQYGTGSEVLQGGGDGNVVGYLDPSSATIPYPRLRVVDKAGTVYSFFSDTTTPVEIPSVGSFRSALEDASSQGGAASASMSAYPSTIEDHNGNLFQVQWEPNVPTTGATNFPTPGIASLDVTDSLGRDVLSIRPPTAQTPYSTITVPGESSYEITTQSVAINAPSTGLVNDVYTYSPYNAVVNNSSGDIMLQAPCPTGHQTQQPTPAIVQSQAQELASIPDTVVLSISLPNGESYQFTYDYFGKITQITYPSGAWVKYQWGQTAADNSSPPDWPNSVFVDQIPIYQALPVSDSWTFVWVATGQVANCYVAYSSPVIQLRTVGYGSGSSSATLYTQQFSYTTNYNTLIAPKSAVNPNVPYKTTTVITTDQETGKQTTTKYSYTPSYTAINGNVGSEYQGAGIVNNASNSLINPPPVPTEQSIVKYDFVPSGTGTLLSTTTKSFFTGFLTPTHQLCEFQTSASGQTTGHFYGYNWDGKMNDDKEYGFGSGAGAVTSCASGGAAPTTPDRETVTTYQKLTNPNSLLFSVPTKVAVQNSTSGEVKETDYGYDQSNVTSASVLSGTHDDAMYPSGNPSTCTSSSGATNQPCRGNVTTETESCLSVSGCVPISRTFTYDYTGQMTSMTDGRGNTITASYTDSALAGNSSSSGVVAGNSNAYLTTLTMPTTNGVAHVRTFKYDYILSKMTQSKDENNQTTTYQYNDPLLRLTGITEPTSAQTTYAYVDGATSTVTTTDPTGIISVNYSDALGRKYASQITTASPVLTTSYVTYNGLGTVASSYNPTNCISGSPSYTTLPSNCGENTWGITNYQYDSLGRKTFQMQQDGTSKRQWCYEGIASIAGQTNCHARLASANGGVGGTWVDSIDENGNDWQRLTDAFGRLTAVLEPNGVSSSSPTMETDYYYDLLNNLLAVAQNGQSGDTARYRTFVYNPLSQLVRSANPETGIIGYVYDSDGNLLNKTDARSVTTSYLYDQLNRVYSKTYSDNSTPSSCYQYDTSSVTLPSGVTTGNWVGRLTNAWTQSASAGSCPPAPPTGFSTNRSITAYDSIGRITNEQQLAPSGTPYVLAYSYDLAGKLITSTSGAGPAPFTFTNAYDSAGRLTTLSNSWTNTNLFPATLFQPSTVQNNPCANSTTAQYWPFGGLANALFGNGLTLSRVYDNRLRASCENNVGSTVTNATNGSATVTITGTEQQ